MMGRNHLLSGAASLVIVTGGAALVDKEWGNPIGDAVASGVGFVADYMMAGQVPFSLYTAVCVFLYTVGLLLPDIDSSSSIFGRKFPWHIKHRTWTHSLWPVFLIGVVSVYMRPFAWLAFGYLVHLFWDSLSRQGVCWFYPIPGFIEYGRGARVKRNHWFWLYRANSTAERVVTWSSVIVAVVVFIAVMASGVIPLTTAMVPS